MLYVTTFSGTENPIVEGGRWLNGARQGRDWSNFQIVAGKAYGTQSGNDSATTIGVTPSRYADSIACLLPGPWKPDIHVRAVVFNTSAAVDASREVELHGHTYVNNGIVRTIEVEYSCDPLNPYLDIVRWNGTIADFTPLALSTGGTHLANMPGGEAKTGDVLDAFFIGSTISAYKNGVLMATATDTTYTDGSPGMGHFLANRTGTGDPSTYGFTFYMATDELGPSARSRFAMAGSR